METPGGPRELDHVFLIMRPLRQYRVIDVIRFLLVSGRESSHYIFIKIQRIVFAPLSLYIFFSFECAPDRAPTS